MSTYTWSVRFDDGSSVSVSAQDAVAAARAAVKLHNSSVVEYDDAGGKLAPVNRANSENIIALERLHAAEYTENRHVPHEPTV